MNDEISPTDPIHDEVRNDPLYQELQGVLVKGLRDAINPDTVDAIVELPESERENFITSLFNQIANNPGNQHLRNVLEAPNVNTSMKSLFKDELKGDWHNLELMSQNKDFYEDMYVPIMFGSIAHQTLIRFKKDNPDFVPRLN